MSIDVYPENTKICIKILIVISERKFNLRSRNLSFVSRQNFLAIVTKCHQFPRQKCSPSSALFPIPVILLSRASTRRGNDPYGGGTKLTVLTKRWCSFSGDWHGEGELRIGRRWRGRWRWRRWSGGHGDSRRHLRLRETAGGPGQSVARSDCALRW